VINAIKNAIGVWVCDLPATPDKIKAALAGLKR
jgi:aldehyde oxidoreductase